MFCLEFFELLIPEQDICLLVPNLLVGTCGFEGVWLPLAASRISYLLKFLKFNYSELSYVVLFLCVVSFLPPNEFF